MEWFLESLPAILCMLVGVGLLIAEAFMPGFGVAGISGILFEAAAVILIYFRFGTIPAAIALLAVLTVIAIVLSISLRSAAKGKLSKSGIILNTTESTEDGYVSSDDTKVFLGREGVATTVLRPTGMAEFDGVRLNVMTNGEFIEPGTKVRIEKTEGSRIIVRAL